MSDSSLHFSPLYVARVLRRLFDEGLAQEDSAGVVVTTSSWLEGERIVQQDVSAIAAGEW